MSDGKLRKFTCCSTPSDCEEELKAYLSTITNIHFSGNDIGDEGAESLADALAKNTTITNISLSDNHIKPEGAESLADALAKNTTITNINLSENHIKPEG